MATWARGSVNCPYLTCIFGNKTHTTSLESAARDLRPSHLRAPSRYLSLTHTHRVELASVLHCAALLDNSGDRLIVCRKYELALDSLQNDQVRAALYAKRLLAGPYPRLHCRGKHKQTRKLPCMGTDTDECPTKHKHPFGTPMKIGQGTHHTGAANTQASARAALRTKTTLTRQEHSA